MLVPHFGLDAFVQGQNDLLLRLDLRLATGGGVRIVGIERERFGIWGGSGYMAEVERRDLPPDGPDALRVLNHRWTTYVAWRAVLVPDHLTWLDTAYVQPRLDDPTDVQILEEFAVEVHVIDGLSFSTGFRLRYDSQPPKPVVPMDVRWTTGVTVRWERRPAPPE